MRVDPVHPAELAAHYYYLEQMGLNNKFTPGVVDNNEGARYFKEKGWKSLDLKEAVKKLHVSQNKYLLIRLMATGDIINLLGLLDKKYLLEGLRYMPKSRMIKAMAKLSKLLLFRMMLSVFSLFDLMRMFSPEVLLNLMRSERMDSGELVNTFKNVPVEILRRLMEEILGKNMDNCGQREMLAMLWQLPKPRVMEGLMKMPARQLLTIICSAIQRNPDLLLSIPKQELLRVMEALPKSTLMEMLRMLPEHALVQMLSQLPDQYLALAASAVDTATLESILIQQYPNLIQSLTQAA